MNGTFDTLIAAVDFSKIFTAAETSHVLYTYLLLFFFFLNNILTLFQMFIGHILHQSIHCFLDFESHNCINVMI